MILTKRYIIEGKIYEEGTEFEVFKLENEVPKSEELVDEVDKETESEIVEDTTKTVDEEETDTETEEKK